MIETINWFQSNFLILNCDKTHFLQFLKKHNNKIKMQTISSTIIITNIKSTRFLGLTIDSSLSWKDHIFELTSKLNKACYAIRAIKPFMSLDLMKMVYYSYVQSVMSYSIISCGISHLSGRIFKFQKRIIRIITNAGKRDSCCQLYKQLKILTRPSLYIFSLLLFVNKNRSLFLSNSEIHDRNILYNHNLHLPSTNLTLVQKGVLYSGSMIYNYLPLNIKVLSKAAKIFTSKLRSNLIVHSIVWMNIIN